MAGLTAAIEAHDAGANVLVLEKLDRIGGSAITSGGIVYGTNTLMNQDIDNDPEDMVEYYIQRGNDNIDVDLVRFWAEHSGENVNWLIEEMGVEFATLGTSGTSPAMRAHTTANGGAGIILPVFEQFEARGIALRRGTPVTDLIFDGERVTGVVAVCDGATITVNAPVVIVTCGGFDASEDAKELYAPDAYGVACMSSCGNTGDYIAWGEKVGASHDLQGRRHGHALHQPQLHPHGRHQPALLHSHPGRDRRGRALPERVQRLPHLLHRHGGVRARHVLLDL